MATHTQKHSTHPARTWCQDWIRRLKLVYMSRWLYFGNACNLHCICLRSRLNLLSKQRSNYSNQIPLISLRLNESMKAEEELKKKSLVACPHSPWWFHKGSDPLWLSPFVRFHFTLSIKEDVHVREWLHVCNQVSFKDRVNFQFGRMLVERKFCLT